MSNSFSTVYNFFLLGKSLKSHGTAGQLRLMIEEPYKSYLQKGSFLFFDCNGSKVPYMITDLDEGAHTVISLEDVHNKKESDLLSGLDIWIPLDIVKPRHQRSPKNLSGKWDEFSIEDLSTNTIYKVERVEEFPQQLMAVIKIDESEKLIPLSDLLIVELDRKNKMIRMNLPEGLLEI